MRALISIICLSLCPLLTHAAEDHDAIPENIESIKRKLTAYFDAGTANTRQITLIANVPITPKALLSILRTVRLRLQNNLTSLETWGQADELMIVLNQMLAETPSLPTLEPEVRTALEQEANTLLYSYVQPSRSQNGLLTIFDRLELWSPENLWFFMRDGMQNEILQHHAYRIYNLIPQLNSGQKRQLANYLRQPTLIDKLVANCLLYKLEKHTGADLVTLLREASLQFARSIWRISRLPQADKFVGQRNFTRPQPDNFVIAATLKDLQAQLAQADSKVTAAFADAVQETRSQRPMGYDRPHRVLFFEMLQDQSLDWLSREQWLKRAAKESTVQETSLRGRYRLLVGNIIKVGFPKNRTCVTALERPPKKSDR